MSSIKKGSKEFYEVIEAFEMHVKNSTVYVADLSRVDRNDENTPNGYFYNNGTTNNLFLMFMSGYVSAKANYQ
jgi:hypothetical protein